MTKKKPHLYSNKGGWDRSLGDVHSHKWVIFNVNYYRFSTNRRREYKRDSWRYDQEFPWRIAVHNHWMGGHERPNRFKTQQDAINWINEHTKNYEETCMECVRRSWYLKNQKAIDNVRNS